MKQLLLLPAPSQSPSHPRQAVPAMSRMRSRIHRATTIRPRANPDRAVEIDEYIIRASASMTADALRALRRFDKNLVAKLATEQARQHSDLHESVTTLRVLLRSERVTNAADPLPQELAEAGIALEYLLKGADMIPDAVPEIGLTDDARVVARVIERNPGLRG